jgi:hypothetical protein
MRLIPLVVCSVLFSLPAKADKFWLEDPESHKNAAAGSSPAVIEGVLISEDADGYHVRTVGGEIVLAKKSVFKVEKDGMTLDAIVKAEGDAAKPNQAADQERQMAQAADRRAAQVKAVEAAAHRGSATPVEAAAPAPAAAEAVYDPVLDVIPARQGVNAVELVRDLTLAHEVTGRRDVLKALRIARRLN